MHGLYVAEIYRLGAIFLRLPSFTFTLSLKNAPTLASCIFDKHGLTLIILGKQRQQHTFKNDMHIQLSLSTHVYLMYLFGFK